MNPFSFARRPAIGHPSARLSFRRQFFGPTSRGVTLIELMVALAITMIMMTAVVTLFANLSSTVSNSRALIELSERLRAARNRLQQDLAGHTATTLPPLRPEDGEGYLEITEGPNNDAGSVQFTNTGGTMGELGEASVPNPVNSQLIAYPGVVTNGLYPNSIMGDADDVLALTVRSQGEPFVGWGFNTATNTRMLVESPTAEVIWYAVPNGRSLPTTNGSPVQLYTLYRRVLLVSPQSVPTGPVASANAASAIQFGTTNGGITTNPATIPLFYNNFDISVRSVADSTNKYNVAVGNSLTDLTNRQNRFLHAFALGGSGGVLMSPGANQFSSWPATVIPPTTMNVSSFPYQVQNPSYAVNSGGGTYLTSLLVSVPAALTNGSASLNNAVNSNIPNPTTTLNPTMALNQRLGEDIILTDVLSFDIRVFDPMAPLISSVTASGATEVLVPSDPGYAAAVTNHNPAAGIGAFVDLGYGYWLTWPSLTSPKYNPPLGLKNPPRPPLYSYFGNFPNAISTASGANNVSIAADFNSNAQLMPLTYDTFSLGYEQNNFDEDETNSSTPGVKGLLDQGTDGLDDDPPTNTNGVATPDGVVDNAPQLSAPYLVSNGTTTTVTEGWITAGERETLPPYPFPLRGVQIILRVYEPDTRQVRQVTVVQDFLPD